MTIANPITASVLAPTWINYYNNNDMMKRILLSKRKFVNHHQRYQTNNYSSSTNAIYAIPVNNNVMNNNRKNNVNDNLKKNQLSNKNQLDAFKLYAELLNHRKHNQSDLIINDNSKQDMYNPIESIVRKFHFKFNSTPDETDSKTVDAFSLKKTSRIQFQESHLLNEKDDSEYGFTISSTATEKDSSFTTTVTNSSLHSSVKKKSNSKLSESNKKINTSVLSKAHTNENSKADLKLKYHHSFQQQSKPLINSQHNISIKQDTSSHTFDSPRRLPIKNATIHDKTNQLLPSLTKFRKDNLSQAKISNESIHEKTHRNGESEVKKLSFPANTNTTSSSNFSINKNVVSYNLISNDSIKSNVTTVKPVKPIYNSDFNSLVRPERQNKAYFCEVIDPKYCYESREFNDKSQNKIKESLLKYEDLQI